MAGIELAILGLALLELVLVAVGLMDLVQRPQPAWSATGRRRGAWIAALLVSTLLPVPLIVVPLWYLLRVRPALARV